VRFGVVIPLSGLLCALAGVAFAVDTDGDGLEDAQELAASLAPLTADTDGDGLFDHLDEDMDGDGIPNTDECRAGAFLVLRQALPCGAGELVGRGGVHQRAEQARGAAGVLSALGLLGSPG
jgi:hypothetical protein